MKIEGRILKTNLVGSYNSNNVRAAIAVGRHFGVSLDAAFEAIAAYVPSNNRSQMTKTVRNTLIVDAYNANPSSMGAALDNFSLVSSDNKVALLGDMRELGEVSQGEHKRIVEDIRNYGFTDVWLVGSEFAKAAQGCGFRLFPDVEAVNGALQSEPVNGKTILIKGSNSIGLTKTITNL